MASGDYISAAQLMLIAHSLSQPILVGFSADRTLLVRQFTIYNAPNLQNITSTQTVNSCSLSEEFCHSLSSLHRSAVYCQRSDAVHWLAKKCLFADFWFFICFWLLLLVGNIRLFCTSKSQNKNNSVFLCCKPFQILINFQNSTNNFRSNHG